MHKTYEKWLNDGCPKVLCGCGCNNEIIIKKSHKYDGIPKYIHGHYWKNKHHTENAKQKIGNGNTGKKRSLESIEKMRISHLGLKQSPESIKKTRVSNIGRRNSFETISKMIFIQNLPKIKEKHCGKNNGAYIDGRSYEPYCKDFNEQRKEKIRKRDDYICQMPGCLCTQLENLILYKCRLDVHHIHYDKKNCKPDLITLCHSCNSKVNSNRNYWEEIFMNILKKEV